MMQHDTSPSLIIPAPRTEAPVAGLVFDGRSGDLLVSLAPRPEAFGGTVSRWRYDGGQAYQRYELPLEGRMMRGAVAVCGELLAVGSEAGLALRRLDSAELIRELPGPCAEVGFAYDGSYVVAEELHKPVGIYDTGLSLRRRLGDGSTYAHRVECGRHTRRVAVASSSKPYRDDGRVGWTPANVSVYDVEADSECVLAHPTGVDSLGFISGDRLLACGCADGVLRLWDVHERELVRQARVLRTDYSALVCTDTPGTRIAVSSGQCEISVLDLDLNVRQTVQLRSTATAVALLEAVGMLAAGDVTGRVTLLGLE